MICDDLTITDSLANHFEALGGAGGTGGGAGGLDGSPGGDGRVYVIVGGELVYASP